LSNNKRTEGQWEMPIKLRCDDLIIRRAKLADVPEMARIINAWAAKGLMLPRSHYDLYQHLRDFAVAEYQGRIVGCGALHFFWKDLAEIRSLAVSEDWQRRGCGRKLVDFLLQEALSYDLPKVFCLTYQQGFFEKLGFRVISRESLPQKIWGDCLSCPKFTDCDEIAMQIEFDRQEMRDGQKG